MSKMSEISAIIEEMRKCAAAISNAANSLSEMFSTAESTPETVTDALSELVLTLEDVRAVCAVKSRNGFTAEVKALLKKHGADKLSGIDPANYKALLADVEVLGNAT